MKDVLSVANRLNNKKRSFLFVNRLQGKHIPCSPTEAVNFMGLLGNEVLESVTGKVGVLAFAETATAIGAIVADVIGEDTYYITTTREKLDKDILVEFVEEHSHAPEQLLYGDANKIKELDTLVLVDDEFTTCKTIENCVKQLKEKNLLKSDVKIILASLSNCLSDERYKELEDRGYELKWLFRFDKGEQAERQCECGCDKNNDIEEEDKVVVNNYEDIGKRNVLLTRINFDIKTQFRTGCDIKELNEDCELMRDVLKTILKRCGNREVCVVGTEECMYKAIKLGEFIEKECKPASVVTQSTTRSPIKTCKCDTYPIKNHIEFVSVYDKDRKTFLYNLKKYDIIILVTDTDKECLTGLIGELSTYCKRECMVID